MYEKFISVGIPYKDYFLEYPVGFTIILYLARILRIELSSFIYYFISLVALAGLISFYFLYEVIESRLETTEFIKKSFFIALVFSPFFLFHYDIFPVLFSILAFYFLMKGRYNLSFVFLGLGTLFKYYPIIFVLPFTFYLIGKRVKLRKVLSAEISLLFVLIGFSALWILLVGLESITVPLGYLLRRGLHVESLLGGMLALFPQFNIVQKLYFEVVVPSWITQAYSFLAVGALVVYILSSFRRLKEVPTEKILAWSCLLGLLILITFFKVLSPQFLLWLFPFVILLYGYTKNSQVYWVYIFILVLSDLIILNTFYWALLEENGRLLPAVFINIRNAVLFYYLLYVWRLAGRLEIPKAKTRNYFSK
jgi:hypothetical protein